MTPFANSDKDPSEIILKRISEGQMDLVTGNWMNISAAAKVINSSICHFPCHALHTDNKYVHTYVCVHTGCSMCTIYTTPQPSVNENCLLTDLLLYDLLYVRVHYQVHT